MDKDRKRRDWLEAQTLVEESDNWTDPDRQVLSLSDEDLQQARQPGAASRSTPSKDDRKDFLEPPTNVWEEDPTPLAPGRVERPSGWTEQVTGPHREPPPPPVLEDVSLEQLAGSDEHQPVSVNLGPVYPEEQSGELVSRPDSADPPAPHDEHYSGPPQAEYPVQYEGGQAEAYNDLEPADHEATYQVYGHGQGGDERYAAEGYDGDYEYDDYEYEDDVVVDPGRQLDAPSNIKVRVVHEISPDRDLVVMTRPGSMSAEQYRVLSLKLREDEHRRVISVLVPTKEVDGPVVAANLALALAEGSRSSVVLLDANLRGRQMMDVFGLDSGMPLGEQIRHHKSNPDDPWEVLGLGPSFHVVPARAVVSNPSALLSSEILADFIDDLRENFDFVIISAPPVMEAADSVILQDYVDGAILVALAGVTRQDSVRASLARLGPAKLMGSVLMGTRKVKE